MGQLATFSIVRNVYNYKKFDIWFLSTKVQRYAFFLKKFNWMDIESWVKCEFSRVEKRRAFIIFYLFLVTLFFYNYNFLLLWLPKIYLTVVCWIPSYFFWFRHMVLEGKIFCCPTILLFFTIIVVGIINTGANYAEPPVPASLIPIVNSVAICSDVFRGFTHKFANLANFRI